MFESKPDGYDLSVKEQPPLKNSIYCQVRLTRGEFSTLSYGNMYFVCNLKKVVTQYPNWMDKFHIEQLNKLGYKLKVN